MARHVSASMSGACGNYEAYWALSDIGEAAIDDRTWTCPHCGWEAEVGEVVENGE